MMPVTVGTTTDSTNGIYSCQRKQFFANGLFWVLYSNGTNLVYSTSPDGVKWTVGSSSPIRAAVGAYQFSVFFDGTYFHYVYASANNNDALVYRMGIPNSNGSISWLAVEQTVTAAAANNGYANPTIVVSGGFPWIGYFDNNSNTFLRTAFVATSTTKNGTWTTAAGFPFSLGTSYTDETDAILVPLTNQKIYAILSIGNTGGGGPQTLKGRLYNGGWGPQETCTTSNIISTNPMRLSTVAISDNVNIVFIKDVTFDIIYVQRTFSSGIWSSETTVQQNVGSTVSPALAVTVSGVLVLFWLGSPNANQVYYKLNTGSSWDAAPTNWINESPETLLQNYECNCAYQDSNGVIGVYWTGKTVSPYDVRFQALTITVTMVTAGDGLSSFVYQTVTAQ